MSIRGSGAIATEADVEKREGRSLGVLRLVALIVSVVGALGSVSLTLWFGRRNPSYILPALFAIWVLSPFVALLNREHGFKAMVSHYPSDALLRDAGSHACLFVHLLLLCLLAAGVRSCCCIPYRTDGIMASYDDNCPDRRVHIRKAVTSSQRLMVN